MDKGSESLPHPPTYPPTDLPQEQTLTGWALRNWVWTPGGLVCHSHKGHPPRPGQRETSSPAGSPSPAPSVEGDTPSGNRDATASMAMPQEEKAGTMQVCRSEQQHSPQDNP
ncbi:hypothetical protein D4764_02G0000090 [Takifugu flavidus]|uniref:Uncharacterized protein n=1 Tax=Takifugu flavidus TaxID=433684 RepID=A0A5C6NJP0_9TELE|nr:hypothetical protein D4764_02G0000090 [Takifugu flavidus]